MFQNKIRLTIGKLVSLIILSIVLVFSTAINAQAKQSIKILYVGNSLTSANDIPYLVGEMAHEKGITIEYIIHTPGGQRLKDHASNENLLQTIENRKWDIVVLQEQSQYPGFSKKIVEDEVLLYAMHLSEIVRESSPKAKIVFYQTMARRYGDPDNINVSPELGNYEGMQRRVNRTYEIMAEENEGILAPVGEVWQRVRKEQPSIELYKDDIHPNVTGSYLVACVLFKAFFSKSPVGLDHPETIKSSEAKYIQKIVNYTRFK